MNILTQSSLMHWCCNLIQHAHSATSAHNTTVVPVISLMKRAPTDMVWAQTMPWDLDVHAIRNVNRVVFQMLTGGSMAAGSRQASSQIVQIRTQSASQRQPVSSMCPAWGRTQFHARRLRGEIAAVRCRFGI